jgi:hypothetical protein
LLRYFPKAAAGRPDVLNAMTRADLPEIRLEILATFESDHVKLIAQRRGVTIPGAVFHTVDSDLNNSEVTAGPGGFAIWSPPASGHYSVYVKDVVKEGGTSRGQSYDEIREFATLAFRWPLDRQNADADAVALFQKAVATRASWDHFEGFSAEASGMVDGRPFAGKVTVSADGEVKAEVDDPVARPWIEAQLGSIAMHRLPENDRGASSDRPKPVVRFADQDEEHPLGRLLAFQGGRFASSYRIKDGQISVVNRHMGAQTMTITVLENTPTPEGKFLPRTYQVQYWDSTTGRLNRVETVQERWSRIGSLDLPVTHTVSTTSDSGLSVRSLTLAGHKVGK